MVIHARVNPENVFPSSNSLSRIVRSAGGADWAEFLRQLTAQLLRGQGGLVLNSWSLMWFPSLSKMTTKTEHRKKGKDHVCTQQLGKKNTTFLDVL